MNADFLSALPGEAYAFMMVMCRVSAAVMLAPGVGDDDIPTIVKAGMALALTFVVLPVVLPLFPTLPQQSGVSIPATVALIASEMLIGGLIGWLAKLMSLSLPIAGQIISIMIGLSSVLQSDPDLGSQTTALSRMMSVLVPTVLMASGLYIIPVAALVHSYAAFPPGHLLASGDLARSVVMATKASFSLAMEFAAPFILIGTVWQVMLGLLSRFVPALQVYNLSLPAQLLGGLLLVALLMSEIIRSWSGEMDSAFRLLPGF